MIDGHDTTMRFDVAEDPAPDVQLVHSPEKMQLWIWLGLLIGASALGLRELARAVWRVRR